MLRPILFLLFLCSLYTPLQAQPACYGCYGNYTCCLSDYCDCGWNGDAWVGLGYRQDHFRWSISGPTGTPNILSELVWEKLGIIETSCSFWNAFPCGLYYRAGASFGSIIHGKVTDTDYAEDNRRGIWSKINGKADRGRTFDAIGGLGWQFSFLDDGLLLAVLGGVSTHDQSLHFFHGDVIINTLNPGFIGLVHGLDSKYHARWYSGWGGIDLVWQLCPEWVINGNFEYHRCRYRGRGDWNLREDFDGQFYQKSNGHGLVGKLGLSYAFSCDWLFMLNLTGQRWEAKGGVDYTNVLVPVTDPALGGTVLESVRLETPFHEAQWWSYGAMLCIEYRY